MKAKKVILIIRDGWGYRKKENFLQIFFSKKKNIFNAINLANTKYTDMLEKKYPIIHLDAAGSAVGLPEGFMGNSEVGHMTLGAGRIFKQSLLRINDSIKSGAFLRNKKILSLIQNVKKSNSKFHLMILMQDAGVHSHINHLFETLKVCKTEGLQHDQVVLHLITDGRDTKPKSGIDFLTEVVKKIKMFGVGTIGTISGRYFAMDRNNNQDRTKKYFDAFFYGESDEPFFCDIKVIVDFYKKDITDEFIPPLVKEKYNGVKRNDSIFFLNFRKDRAIQISEKINKVSKKISDNFLTMTNYSKKVQSQVFFNDLRIEDTLGDILEKNNKTQLRISETEKYAHVTFFFDGGVVKKHVGKKEVLINSPNVKTYDLEPEMNSLKLTEKVISEISLENKKDFILVNFPNVDMVSHTGNIEATIKAIESVDTSVYEIVKKGLKNNYVIVVTADHGNAEEISNTNRSHTNNKVQCIFISEEFKNKKNILKSGEFGLGNISSTILEIMGIKKNKNLNESLLVKK